ncbi:MAG: hypothetical protein GXY42_03575 [Desulfovibrionales bacterium]|nr:hypothetical protein [Desulfovibrionales bacterium]
MSVVARWNIELIATCPACGLDVDLTNHPDFWIDHDFGVAIGRQRIAAFCPECETRITVDTE